MKKSVKISITIFLTILALIITAFAAYFIITADAKLDRTKLINYSQTISFLDDSGNRIESSSIECDRSTVLINELPSYTKNAFIASEDRQFYEHNGLNYRRMLKALFKNTISLSFKEGASTISQQLIKNTHLSNDKTLTRKLKEIHMTRQLEAAYSKDEILEMYLNTIYFGHNCFGLQSAANFYFGERAENLTLEQSATLAGLLSSPNNYSPFKNAEKCLQRRNLVLKNMAECNFIDRTQCAQSVSQPLDTVNKNSTNYRNSYIAAVTDELDLLDLDYYNDLSGSKIYTYMDADIQNYIENLPFENDGAVIITDSNNGVTAYKNTIGNAKRQPGSTIKPVLVYAPAIEEGIIHSFTKIEDCPIDFSGYSPENHDKKYHGMVTVAQSIAHSYNIPAVKTLNFLTIKKAAEYANKLDIDLDDEDLNLSLALGGMKYGIPLKNLCDSYSTFRNNGNYQPSHFIKKIVNSNGQTIYSAPQIKTKAFSEGTCSLMNEMLMQTTNTGTAKKLKNLSYDLAAKTGTCGDDSGNTDAYAIGYTSRHTICVWLGDRNNTRTDITGGGQCCNILKDLLTELYNSQTPPDIETSAGTTEIYIDRQDYESSGKIIIADTISPALNKLKVKCLSNNLPEEISTKFTCPTITHPEITVADNIVSISLCKTQYYSYIIKRDNEVIYDGDYREKIHDTPEEGRHTYTVTPYYSFNGKKYSGKEIVLNQVNVSTDQPSYSPPPITQKEWYYN